MIKLLKEVKRPRDYWVETFDSGWMHVQNDDTRVPIDVPGTFDVPVGELAVVKNKDHTHTHTNTQMEIN